MRKITMVFNVEDEEAFGEINPMKITVHGLKAVAVSVGDLITEKEVMLEKLQIIVDEAYSV